MADTFGAYATNKQLEREGVPVLTTNGGTFLLKRMGGANRAYFAAREKAYRDYRRAKAIPHEVQVELDREVFISNVLTGWCDSKKHKHYKTDKDLVCGPDGKPLPYGKAKAAWLFDELPDLYWELVSYAQDPDFFKDFDQESDAKN